MDIKGLRKFIRETIEESFVQQEAKTISLDPSLDSQLKAMVPTIIAAMEERKKLNPNELSVNSKDLTWKDLKYIDVIPFQTIHGIPEKALIYIAKIENADGIHRTQQDHRMIVLSYDIQYITPNKIYRTLYHEFTHAVDPAVTSKKPVYAKQKLEKNPYYASDVELNAYSAEFLNLIINVVKENLSDPNRIKNIHQYLRDTLNQFLDLFNNISSIQEPDDELSKFIAGGKQSKKNFLHHLKMFSEKYFNQYYDRELGIIKDFGTLSYFVSVFKRIKENNPQNYNKFLQKLFSTIQEANELIDADELKTKKPLTQKIADIFREEY